MDLTRHNGSTTELISASKHMKIIVDNRIRVPLGVLTSEAIEALKALGVHKNPKYAKWKVFRRGKPPPKVVRTYQTDQEHVTLPRGCMGAVRQVLDDHGYSKRTVLDQRCTGAMSVYRELKQPLYDFQEQMCDSLLEHQNCLWHSPPGSGKTQAALGAIVRAGRTALVIVSNTSLLDQWVRRCEKVLGLPPEQVGIIQGKRRVVKDITIAMDATLRNCASEYATTFGTIVCDEVQRFAAPSLQNTVDALNSKYRLGVSADEKRADGMEFLIYQQFGQVACEITYEELETRGFIMPVEVRVVPTEFDAPWYRDLKPKQKFDKHDQLLEAMHADDARRALTHQIVEWCAEEDEQLIILSHRREHCRGYQRELIGLGYNCGLFLGSEGSRHEFKATQQQLEAATLKIAAGTYQAIGVGFDLPRIARGVFTTPIATNEKGDKQFRQFRGRFARTCPGKHNSIVYYLWDKHLYGSWPLTLLNRWNKGRVKVLDDREWVDGKEYAKEIRQAERETKTEAEESIDFEA